jgi:fucose 4-O-acetylase-like acetyltransferase
MKDVLDADNCTVERRSTPKPRLAMLDIAKGIGILLIVLGHNTLFSQHFELLAGLLASFRIPFFFFISGVTFSVAGRTVKQIALQRADAWLKPCAVVLVVVGLLNMASGRGGLEALLLSLVFATGFTFTWPPLWFLPHLWLVYVCSAWLLINLKGAFSTAARRSLLFVVSAGLGYCALQMFSSPKQNAACEKMRVFSFNLFDCGLPLSADLLLLTGLYFLAGYFLADRVRAMAPSPLLFGLSATCMVAAYALFPLSMDLNARTYEGLLLSPLQAMLGILSMLCACHYCARVAVLAKFMGYFGRVSLFILIFHTPILSPSLYHLPKWIHSELLVGTLAFVLPVAGSIVLYYLCRRIKPFSTLMFPSAARRPTLVPERSIT